MPYFNYQDRRCYFREVGTGEPLILLHGNTASSNMFESIVHLFKDHFKVVLIDFLGHGKSDRLTCFPVDLWFEEALQTIALIEYAGYSKVNLLGSSGGALAAINVALERPDLIAKVIADSFEGEQPLMSFIEHIEEEREASKHDNDTRNFYLAMHGTDWESVVDNDTKASFRHAKEIGRFFHKPLRELKSEILLTGSLQDEFIPDGFFQKTYSEFIQKIGHGQMHLFQTGGHPAALTNAAEFAKTAIRFLLD